MRRFSRGALVLLGVAATLALTAASLAAVFFLGFVAPEVDARGASCSTPSLAGPVVDVTATDMGGPMMRGRFRLVADRSTVRHGKVTFLVTNAGRLVHEMVVLPLPGNQPDGARAVGGDGRVDETGSLGEASAACAQGAGEGLPPGSSGWVTLDLAPGRYELVCNFPGHYAAGMYTEITVN